VSHDHTITIRAPEALKRKLDNLLPRLEADPRYRGVARLSRATLYRLALDRGAAMLAAELPELPPEPPDPTGPAPLDWPPREGWEDEPPGGDR